MSELPNIGDKLADRYSVGALVEQTPAYTSFRVVDQDAEVEVALWLMKAELYPDDRRKDAFIGAVVDMRGLIHPHLRRLYDAGRSGDSVYLTTQLSSAEGMLLRLGSGRGAPEIDVVRYANAVAEAMDAAHKLGHVHGWMVPWDVVQVAGQIKVGGIGLYRDVELGGARACWRESERYIAPEVRESGIATPSSDVYSMAAVLLEIASGISVPDLGEATEALAADQIKLADVLAQGLAIAPERRPRSAGALAHRIRELMVDERVPTAERKAVMPPPVADPEPEEEEELPTLRDREQVGTPAADSSSAITSPRRTARMFAPVEVEVEASPPSSRPMSLTAAGSIDETNAVGEALSARYALPVSTVESSEMPTMHADADTVIGGAPPPPIVLDVAESEPEPEGSLDVDVEITPSLQFVSMKPPGERRRDHTPLLPVTERPDMQPRLRTISSTMPRQTPPGGLGNYAPPRQTIEPPASLGSRLWMLVIGVAVLVVVAIVVTYVITRT